MLSMADAAAAAAANTTHLVATARSCINTPRTPNTRALQHHPSDITGRDKKPPCGYRQPRSSSAGFSSGAFPKCAFIRYSNLTLVASTPDRLEVFYTQVHIATHTLQPYICHHHIDCKRVSNTTRLTDSHQLIGKAAVPRATVAVPDRRQLSK